MTDEITTQAPAEGAQKPSFFKTSLGRVVIILGALAALAVVVGIIIAVVMVVLFPKTPEVEIRVPEGQQQAPAQSGTETSGTAAAPQPAAVVANDEVFTFRDIFKPLLTDQSAPEEAPSPSEGSTTTPDANEYDANTLYLVSITSGDQPTANMVWDMQPYALQEGDAIPGTPWEVLQIRDDSVVMLFGDQQVILTVGQGIQK